MKNVKKPVDDEVPLRVNTEISAAPARTVRTLIRQGWAASVREAIVLGLKSIEKELLEEELKRSQLKGGEEDENSSH